MERRLADIFFLFVCRFAERKTFVLILVSKIVKASHPLLSEKIQLQSVQSDYFPKPTHYFSALYKTIWPIMVFEKRAASWNIWSFFVKRRMTSFRGSKIDLFCSSKEKKTEKQFSPRPRVNTFIFFKTF